MYAGADWLISSPVSQRVAMSQLYYRAETIYFSEIYIGYVWLCTLPTLLLDKLYRDEITLWFIIPHPDPPLSQYPFKNVRLPG